MKLSIKIKTKFLIIFVILSLTLLSEVNSLFSLKRGRRSRNKSNMLIETDYSKADLVTYFGNRKLHSFPVLVKNALTYETNGSASQSLVAQESDFIEYYKDLHLKFGLSSYFKPLSDELIEKFEFKNKQYFEFFINIFKKKKYIEFNFNIANNKIIPFLDNGFAFTLNNENKKYTPVILNIQESDINKIEILKDKNTNIKLKKEVESQIEKFLINNRENFWLKYNEALKAVTISKELKISIPLKDESLDASLNYLEENIKNFKVFGFSKNNLLGENKNFSVPNPKLQKLIDQFSVLDRPLYLYEQNLKENTFDNKQSSLLDNFFDLFSALKSSEIVPYFSEHVLPYLDCPLNVEMLKLKEIKEKQLFYNSLIYCFSLLYNGSITPLETKIKKINFITFTENEIFNFEDDILKARLFHFILFVQDRKNDYKLLNIPRADGYKTNRDLNGNKSKIPFLSNLAVGHISVPNIKRLDKDYAINTENLLKDNYLSMNEYVQKYKQAVLVLQIKLSKIKASTASSKKFATLNEKERKFLKECESLFMVEAFEDKNSFEQNFKNLVLSLL